MALPRIDTPTYQLILPSTRENIDYRPFLMKEQKIIMMAQESKDDKQIIKAMIDLVTSCTFGKVDISNLPTYDVEFMFLKIRGKSAGESVELNLVCPDDNQTKVQTKVNLDDIQVQMTVGHSNIIDITDDIKLYLRHPLFSDAIALGDSAASDGVFKLLNSCIIKIVYGDTEYNRIDITDKDIEEFIDQLNTDQFEQIINFFNTMPKLRHVVDVVNPKTKVKSEVLLEGLQNFLG
tara:strand:- start:605 stop:1309 length:705 start_codon:yes stop_codon:yes gene_type:complete